MQKNKKVKAIKVGSIPVGGSAPLVLIAGPCVIEGRKQTVACARRLVDICREAEMPLIFKASYDKANRTSIKSYRGPGIHDGFACLREIREQFGVPILTDVHAVDEVEGAAAVADVLQLPAFLCRQTDLTVALGQSGKIVNIKKGQFLAPWDVRHIIEKIEHTGNRKILLTERGACFGYNNLVSDMRSLPVMRSYGYPVVYDATHSVQRPGAGDTGTAGDAPWAPLLARAAVATGCDAVFLETHRRPLEALSDKDNAIALSKLPKLLASLRAIDDIVDERLS